MPNKVFTTVLLSPGKTARQQDINEILSNGVMEFSPSFWEEQSFLTGIDFCVIGAGIVGLNAAIRLKQLAPGARVVVLEKGIFPQGASGRNAGFACVGSMTELLDDLKHRSLDEVMETVKLRWAGLQLLRGQLGDEIIDYQQHGGFEVFPADHYQAYEACMDQMTELNAALAEWLGEREVFQAASEHIPAMGLTGIQHMIVNRLEGQLHTGKMLRRLLQLANLLGVEIWSGVGVESFDEIGERVEIRTSDRTFNCHHLLVATNAFTPHLLSGLDVRAVRNQVIITEPIANLQLRGTFHFHQGYGYFRNVGQRVLIGGFRHLSPQEEETDKDEETGVIQSALENWLQQHILAGKEFSLPTDGGEFWA